MRRNIVIVALILIFAAAGVAIWRFSNTETHTLIQEVQAEEVTSVLSDGQSDSDGDGVADMLDQCDGLITGTAGTDATGCPIRIDPEAELIFNDDLHQLWYRRYWTGSCEGITLPQFCLPGSPSWHDTVQQITDRLPEAERGLMRLRLWALGRAVGYDWSQAHDIRAINTQDLQRWGNTILAAEDVDATLTEIEREICDLLGSGRIEGDLVQGETC